MKSETSARVVGLVSVPVKSTTRPPALLACWSPWTTRASSEAQVEAFEAPLARSTATGPWRRSGS